MKIKYKKVILSLIFLIGILGLGYLSKSVYKIKKTNQFLLIFLHKIGEEIKEKGEISYETKINLAGWLCLTDPTLALEIYKLLEKENKNNINLWINLLPFYILNKEYSTGIKIIEEKIDKKDRDYQIWYLLGELYEKTKDYKKAYEAYKEALKNWPFIENPVSSIEKRDNKIGKNLIKKIKKIERLIENRNDYMSK